MKKIIFLICFLTAFIFGADVKPFVFANVSADSQQIEWDYLMKYKMFGQTGITFNGGQIYVPDKSGWFGTAKGDFNMENANIKHLVGGPILIGGDMLMSNKEDTISTGNVRVTGSIIANHTGFKDGGSVINGYQCVKGTIDWKYKLYADLEKIYEGANYDQCPEGVPQVDTNLTIPTFVDTFTYNNGISLNNGVGYIDVPPGEGTYDYYINSISMSNDSRLVIRMPYGGRLTRVFVKNGFNFQAHPKIRITYMDEDAVYNNGSWSGSGTSIDNKDYAGNLLFYTTTDIAWPAINSTDSIQGTFISTGTISIQQHMTLAGQLLANKIEINFNFDGRGFLYVPFDPPVLNIDPTALASGKFQENNKDVIIPIHLDTLAKTDVYFKYCFILDDKVTQADFNVAVPECDSDVDSVFIPAGDSLPKNNIYLNVKVDGISEGDETLRFHIFDLQGAVMPGNVHSGNFTLTLTDAGVFGFDTAWTYTELENFTGDVDIIRVIGKTENTRFNLDSAFTDRYELDSITGVLKIINAIDYEITQIDTIKVTIKDTNGVYATGYIPIKVTDVNEAPDVQEANIKINENLPNNSYVGKIVATDPDILNPAFSTLTYTILENNVPFKIDNSGVIRVKDSSKLDYETNPKFTFNVVVGDGLLFDTALVTIELNNVQEPPVIIDDGKPNYNVNENEVTDFVIATIKVVDDDLGQIETLTYDIKNNTGADTLFKYTYSVVNDTGRLVISVKDQSKLDYEKITPIQELNIVVTDKDGKKDSITKTISIIDLNEKPILDDKTIEFFENFDKPIPWSIGTLDIVENDTAKAFINNIIKPIGGDTALFKVSENGQIFVTKEFDYETDDSVYTLKVQVADKNTPTLADTATITIKLKDVNEKPVVVIENFTIPETDSVGVVIDTLKATDPEKQALTYTIINDVPFNIDNNGIITNKDTLDYENITEYNVKVVVSDGVNKDTVTIKINVTNVNEPLTIDDATFNVKEDTIGVIGTITGVDIDGDDIEYYINNSDTLRYHIDDNGTITLKEKFDYETEQYDTLVVYATDGKLYDTATVIIKVINVNEPPVLQPNDSLIVKENCDSCVVGVITAIDPDIDDKVIYEVIEDGFSIDSTGTLKTTDSLDYEKDSIIVIHVIAKDTSGASDTLEYIVKVDNENEPVHVDDKTCTIKENYVGNVCQIPATDEDKTTPTYIVVDTTNYEFKGDTLVIKNPIDFEKKTTDTVTVIVTDGVFYDTAKVVIKIEDIPEITTITEVDDKPKQDTIKTNDPDHKIEWEICENGVCKFDSIDVKVHKDTTIKVCNEKKTSCDNVVILFNDAPPVVTLTNAKSTETWIDYITIEEEVVDNKIYVNKKDNPITVIVQDTVRKTEQRFEIEVQLDTIPTKDIKLVDYKYIIDENKATITPIGDNKAEMVEIVKVDGVEVAIKQVINLNTYEPIDSVQTISYTKKVGGKEVVVTYTTDNMTGERLTDYTISYMIDSCTSVAYSVNEKKEIVKNKEGNIGYTISYDYVDDFGNKATASVDIVYDDIPPKVEILSPVKNDVFKTNAVEVKWTVNGEIQDTLTLQRLEKGVNTITRRYVDKAGNESVATVIVIMKEAKDIDVKIIHPVTEINQDKVDEWYSEGNKYNPEKPFVVKVVDPKNDSLPSTIGVGFKVDIALPSVSATGGLASLDDIVKNGQIPVDDNGNIVGASTKGIPVEQYVKEHCTAEFQENYNKNGLNIPLYDVTYYLHLWIWTTTAGYVNDFEVKYTLNDQDEASDAGTVQMVIDWLADKNGSVNASNGKQLGTSSYITRLISKSVAKHRCDYKEQRKGEKTVKKEETTKIFGYKRPKK